MDEVDYCREIYSIISFDQNQISKTLQKQIKKMAAKYEEPAIGIPYNGNYQGPVPLHQHQNQGYYVRENPYQSGLIPPNAVFDDPKGIPLQQTIFRDTPAPFNCVYCGSSGITNVKYDFPLPFSPTLGFIFYILCNICFNHRLNC